MDDDHPTRSAVVWCPDWPVVAARRSPSDAVAIFHGNRVVAASAAARSTWGVERGLRRREAQRRCPSLEVLERDPSAEARAFEAVVAALDDLTPRVEIVRPGLVVFPTLGPSRYFGGDHGMAKRCVQIVAAVLGPSGTVRVGVADAVFAATLAARQARDGGVHVVPAEGSAAFLAPFPVRMLDRDDLVGVLSRLGLHTLGSFAQLPAADVVARFGALGERAHRLARGLDERPPAAVAPAPDTEVAQELDPPIERVDQAAFVGKILADRLLDLLSDRGATCSRIVVAAETEHGEELVRLWRHEGALTAAAIADRIRWQLDGWLNGSARQRPSGGLSRLSVRPDDIIAAKGRQLGFWGGQTEAAERAARVVARVQGLLGPESVRVPERRGGRSPDEQVVAVQADTVDLDRADVDAAVSVVPWPGALPGPAPARWHRSPCEAQVVDVADEIVRVDGRICLSDAPHRLWTPREGWRFITRWAGPWPLDERWWDAARHRRRARIQVVVDDGTAHLVVLEGGHWWVEATYD